MLQSGQAAIQRKEVLLGTEHQEAVTLPEFLTSLETRHEDLLVIDRQSASRIVLLGVNPTFHDDVRRIEDFLSENSLRQQSFAMNANQQKLFKLHLQTGKLPTFSRPNDVQFDAENEKVTVKDTREGLQKATQAISKFLQTIVTEQREFTEPSFKGFVESHDGETAIKAIESKLGCTIRVENLDAEGAEGRQPLSMGWGDQTTLTSQLSTRRVFLKPQVSRAAAADTHTPPQGNLPKVSTKPKIFVRAMSDITKEEHDVLVNSSNEQLDLTKGQVAQALSSIGGPKLQAECRKKYPKGIKQGDIAVTGKHKDILEDSLSTRANVKENDNDGTTPAAKYGYAQTPHVSIKDKEDIHLKEVSTSNSSEAITGLANDIVEELYADHSNSCCSSSSSSDGSAIVLSLETKSDSSRSGDTTQTLPHEKGYGGNNDKAPALPQERERFHSSLDNLGKPLTVTEWHASSSIGADGGTLRKALSDVVLTVPPRAVKEGTPVLIHTAVCTDLDLIRRLLKLPDTEEIVSPLAEYTTDPSGFHFSKHVRVEMPHSLQPGFDRSLLNVYHITLDCNGQVIKTPIKVLQDTKHEYDDEEDLNSEDKDSSHFVTAFTKGTDRDASDLDHTMRMYAEVGEDDKLHIYTDRFCGFVCTYCNRKTKKSPQLFAMLQGSYDWTPQTFPLVKVSLYIWDGRISVTDFTQIHGFEPSRERTLLNLLNVIPDTRLYARLRLCADRGMRFTLDDRGQPLSPVETCFNLPQRLCCGKCLRKGRTPLPMTYPWELRPQPHVTAPSCVSVSLDISHVTADRRPAWLDSRGLETVTSTSHTVKDDGNPENGSQLKQHLSSLTSSQLEGIGRVLLIPESTHEEFDNRHHSEETYRQELAEQCALRISGARHQVSPMQTPGQTPGQPNPTSSAWHSGEQSPPEPTKTGMTQLQGRPVNPHDSKKKESNGLGCAYGEGQASRDGTFTHTTGRYGYGIHRPPAGSTQTPPGMPLTDISLNLSSAISLLPQETYDHSPEDGMYSYFREYQDQPEHENRGIHRVSGHSGQGFNNGQSNKRCQGNARAQRTDAKNPKWPRPSLDGGLANGCDHTNPKIVDDGFETDDEDDDTEVKRPFDSGKRPVDSEKSAFLQEDDEEDEQLNSSFLSVQNASCPSSYG